MFVMLEKVEPSVSSSEAGGAAFMSNPPFLYITFLQSLFETSSIKGGVSPARLLSGQEAL